MGRLKSLLWPLSHPLQATRTAARWTGNPVSERDWIFIVGAPRSGTTLMKTLMVAHSQLGGTDYESTGIFRIRNLETYCPSELGKEQVQQMRAQSPKIVQFYDSVAQAVMAKRGAANFVDKLTIRSWRLRFVTKHYPKARFVNIVRDGRDCLCSARRHPNVLQSESVRGFAEYWRYCVETPQEFINPEQMTTVRYEDLTAEPAETLSQLMEFVNLPFEDAQIDPSVYSTTSTMKKREVHKNLSKSINTKSQQRWRSDLSKADQRTFIRIAGGTLESHDYSTSGSEP